MAEQRLTPKEEIHLRSYWNAGLQSPKPSSKAVPKFHLSEHLAASAINEEREKQYVIVLCCSVSSIVGSEFVPRAGCRRPLRLEVHPGTLRTDIRGSIS